MENSSRTRRGLDRTSMALVARLALAITLLVAAPRFVTAGWEAEAPTRLTVTRDADGTFRVHGEFTVITDRRVAWAVLTDYENLPSFVSSMRSSLVTARDAGRLTVAQHGVGKVGPFTKSVHVTLQVVETELQRIEFRDLSARSFASYSGVWDITETPGGVFVSYDLLVLPRTTPPLFGRSIVGKNALSLLDQVRLEMVRRSVRMAAR